jgi:hypothetical protein
LASRDITLFASASRVAGTYNSDDQTTSFAKGVILMLDITAITGTLDCKIQVKDTVSDTYIDLAGASFAQKSGTFHGMLSVYPGNTVAANVSISAHLSKVWRVVVVSATGPVTFSLLATAVD